MKYCIFRTRPSNVLLLHISITGLVLSSVYRGKVLSVLMVEVQPDPINTIFGLVSFPGNIVSYSNYLLTRFAYVSGEEYTKLEDKLKPVSNIDENYRRVSEGLEAICDTKLSLQYFLRKKFIDKYVCREWNHSYFTNMFYQIWTN
jgi:hypothetical protein